MNTPGITPRPSQLGTPQAITASPPKSITQQILAFYLWASVKSEAVVKADLDQVKSLNAKMRLAGNLQAQLTRLLTAAGGSGNTDPKKFNTALDSKDDAGQLMFDLYDINKMIHDLQPDEPLVQFESRTSVAYWQGPQPSDQELMSQALRVTLEKSVGRRAVWAQELGVSQSDYLYDYSKKPTEAQMTAIVNNLLNGQALTGGINPNGRTGYASIDAWRADYDANKNKDTDIFGYELVQSEYKSRRDSAVAERAKYVLEGGVIRNMSAADLANALERLKSYSTTLTNDLQVVTSNTSQNMSFRSSVNDGCKGFIDRDTQTLVGSARNF